MLIFGRKPSETIQIGDDITITLIDIRGGGVRIGIDAPRAIPVHRGEVYERIRSQGSAQTDRRPEQ